MTENIVLWETAIYVFCATDADGNICKPCKIGVARDPAARIAVIQTACPFKIEPFFFVRAPTRKFALTIEQCAHEAFSGHRAFGEWFNISPVDAAIGILVFMRQGLESLEYPPHLLTELLTETGMTSAINRLWPMRSWGDNGGTNG